MASEDGVAAIRTRSTLGETQKKMAPLVAPMAPPTPICAMVWSPLFTRSKVSSAATAMIATAATRRMVVWLSVSEGAGQDIAPHARYIAKKKSD